MVDPIRILLVANPSEAEAIAEALVQAGLPEPRTGHGGDETLVKVSESVPEVVVMCATLDQGDARSLASAVRSVHPSIRIVLVGDDSGPIRNALDAADFDVDRFIGRPLSPKALAFAVKTCAEEARAEGPTGIADPVGLLPDQQVAQMSGDWQLDEIDPDSLPALGGDTLGESLRLPSATDSNPGVDAAVEEAISRFVADAMDALDQGWVLDRSQAAADQAAPEPAAEEQPPATSPPPEPSPAPQPVSQASEETARVSDPQDVPGWRDQGNQPSWREPTLILSGGSAEGAARTDDAEVGGTSPAAQTPWPDTRDDEFDDLADDLDLAASVPLADLDDLDSDPSAPRPDRVGDDAISSSAAATGTPSDEPERTTAVERPVVSREPSPSGDIGSQLRKKMSQMAQRLFPGRAEKPVDVALAHDAHTDIDLTAIGIEPDDVGIAGPYEQIGSADTFADTNPLSKLEPTPASDSVPTEETDEGTRRRSATSEPPSRGELADMDIATLMGRLLRARFSGRAAFRRGDAEKAVYFEDGRPVFATSNLPHDRMGDLLYREGKITRGQQMSARELVVESGRRMGEILVEMEFLKPRELLPAVRHHIEDIVYSLFAWDTGDFVVHSGDPPAERIRLTRHPAAIILEGVRRKYGPDRLIAGLMTPGAVAVVQSQQQLSAISAVVDLTGSERAILQRFDGERSIDEIAHQAQVHVVEAMQLAFALVALGVAELIDQGTLDRVPTRSRALVGETDLAIDRQRVLAKHSLVAEADYFTLLGVRRDATAFEIRRAYEAARRDFAAAGFPPELQRELAGELVDIGELIEEAYQVLRDDRMRRSYQQNLMD